MTDIFQKNSIKKYSSSSEKILWPAIDGTPCIKPIPSLFLASRKWWVPEDKKSAGKEKKNPGGQPILVIS